MNNDSLILFFLRDSWGRISCYWFCKYLKYVSFTKVEIKKHDVTLSISNERFVSFPSWLVIGGRRTGGMKKEGVKRHDKPSSEPQVTVTEGVWEMEIPGKLPAKQLSNYFLKEEGGSGSGALLEGLPAMLCRRPHPQVMGSTFGTRAEAGLLEAFSGRLGGEKLTVGRPR